MQWSDCIHVSIAKYKFYKCNNWASSFQYNKIKIESHHHIAIMDEYFYYLFDWRVMVYKNCKCTVWLGQISNHLKSISHHMRHKTTKEMQQTMQTHMNIHQNPNKFNVVNNNVKKKIPQLKLHQKLQCMFDSNHCKYIYISTNNINKHWNKQHHSAKSKWSNKSNK